MLCSAGCAIGAGDEGLPGLGRILEDRYGDVVGTALLAGFRAASFSLLVGVWSGVFLMFADVRDDILGRHTGRRDRRHVRPLPPAPVDVLRG